MLTGKSTACAAALLFVCANALFASDTTFVSQGARVKVFPFGSRPVIGEVAKLSYDTLVILPEGNGSALTFHRRDWRKIEIYQGKKSKWLKGGLIGGGGGLAVGLALGLAAQEICDYGCESYPAVGAALGTAFGFGVGAGIGALNTSGERWKEVELPAPPPVALNVGKDGSVRLAFSLRL